MQINAGEVERLVEKIRDEHLDRAAAYEIVDEGNNLIQLRLRREIAARLHYPFVLRSDVPQHLLKTLSMIAFKQYVLNKDITPTGLKNAIGGDQQEKVKELSELGLVTITKKGNRNLLTVSDKFLELFKLPKDPLKIKADLQKGLKDYAMRQLHS